MHRPEDRKYVVCVSSQVGCAMGCQFCATGRMGFRRNLAAWEIVDQVVKIQADSPAPVRGVVFMGMGEPMLNYDRVMRAAQHPFRTVRMAIAGKAITISTAGIVPGIRRFTAERHSYRLVVSLTPPTRSCARELMPIESTLSDGGFDARDPRVSRGHGTAGTLAWIMISGVNTRELDAQMLARLTARTAHQVGPDRRERSQRSIPAAAGGARHLSRCVAAELAMPVAHRYSGGQDIHAACGMLVGK